MSVRHALWGIFGHKTPKGDPLLLEFHASLGDVGINLIHGLWNIEGHLGVETKFGLELLSVIRFDC